jgi:hypothetical protein
MGRDRFMLLGPLGVVYASVCTNLPDDAATVRLNEDNPTGIESSWEISSDPMFADGVHTNPCDCPQIPGCRHVLFNC